MTHCRWWTNRKGRTVRTLWLFELERKNLFKEATMTQLIATWTWDFQGQLCWGSLNPKNNVSHQQFLLHWCQWLQSLFDENLTKWVMNLTPLSPGASATVMLMGSLQWKIMFKTRRMGYDIKQIMIIPPHEVPQKKDRTRSNWQHGPTARLKCPVRMAWRVAGVTRYMYKFWRREDLSYCEGDTATKPL